MNHALRADCLAVAERAAFDQHGAVAATAQKIQQPQSGNAAADDDDVHARRSAH